MRTFLGLFVCCLAVFLTMIWVLSPPTRLAAYFGTNDCRTVTLISETGHVLTGIEDLHLRNDSGQIILSAYDRGNPDAPAGGLYATSLFGLTGGGTLRVRTLYAGAEDGSPFRPHGISLTPNGQRLAVIVRGDDNDAWIETGPLDATGWAPDRRVRGRRLCRANDLALSRNGSDDMLITLDRAECGTSFSDLAPGAATGRLAHFNGEELIIVDDELAFPNGLVGPFVAETRGAQILVPRGAPIPLPGGPDNLSFDEAENIVVAVHPNLFQLWLYKEGMRGRAPTRVLRVDPRSRAIQVLFDDPEGLMYSAATSAIFQDGIMVAGSVKDRGLLVCRK